MKSFFVVYRVNMTRCSTFFEINLCHSLKVGLNSAKNHTVCTFLDGFGALPLSPGLRLPAMVQTQVPQVDEMTITSSWVFTALSLKTRWSLF
jgi:hypothetical protein